MKLGRFLFFRLYHNGIRSYCESRARALALEGQGYYMKNWNAFQLLKLESFLSQRQLAAMQEEQKYKLGLAKNP